MQPIDLTQDRKLEQWTNGSYQVRANLLEAISYQCGHCGIQASSQEGLALAYFAGTQWAETLDLRFCPQCRMPTVLEDPKNPAIHRQSPIYPPGAKLVHTPNPLRRLYDEARASFGVGAFTASALVCRKMLMNTAVQLGRADARPGVPPIQQGESFVYYVNWLEAHHYLSPGSKPWVDQIRTKGNEANHEVHAVTEVDARVLLRLTEALLSHIYEVPGALQSGAPAA